VKHPPRNIVLDWINTIWTTNLPPSAKLVACCLRRYMNSQNDMAWPSIARVTGECGFKSSRTTQMHLKTLCDEGWLGKVGTSKHSTVIYQAQTPANIAPLQKTTLTPANIAPELNKELNNTSPSKEKEILLVQSVIDHYHDSLPDLPSIRKMTTKRQRQILKVNKEVEQNGGWEEFFAAVYRSDFLMGRNKRGWKADLEWLTNETNLNKLLEGKYQ
jgi:hypothetical protein